LQQFALQGKMQEQSALEQYLRQLARSTPIAKDSKGREDFKLRQMRQVSKILYVKSAILM
jgi:hypothetical protein